MKRVLAALALVSAVLVLTAGIGIAQTITNPTTHQDGYASVAGGGGMVSDDGQIDWSVPANAYSDALTMRYIPNITNDRPTAPAGSVFVSQVFELQVWTQGTGRQIATDRPMSLRVHYNPANLGGRSESTLRVVRLYRSMVRSPQHRRHC